MPRGIYKRQDQSGTQVEAQAVRPDPRPQLRPEDPRARAAARAAELRGHIGDLDEGTDNFYVDPNIIPDGWSYEWKTRTVLGKEDPAYQVALARTGWEPVPADRHPVYMPKDYAGKTIERDGMVLMERPLEITRDIQNIDQKRARSQVQIKEEQLNAAPQGHFDRDADPRTRAKIVKSYEPMQIPD